MSRQKSYAQQNYKDESVMVMQPFIEGAIQAVCASRKNDRAFFEFTSEYRNVLDHKEPKITEETRVIYYTLPPQHTFTSGEEFLKIAKSGEFKDSDPLPDCFYSALTRNNFDIVKQKKDNEWTTKPYRKLKKEMKTFEDLPECFWSDLKHISTKVVATGGNSHIREHVKFRTAEVCKYLPKHRPIKLAMPVHFGGHYHTHLAEIREDNEIILRSVTTIKSSAYPDKEVLQGMKEGIIEALGLEQDIKTNTKIIDAPQKDGHSCGAISALVCTQLDPSIPLAEQDARMKNTVAAYPNNKQGIRTVLADISYSVLGLVMTDKEKRSFMRGHINSETYNYCSLFNERRPYTFGIRIRQKDHYGIFAARITEENCEIVSISSFDKSFNTRTIQEIQGGISAALGISNDDFFLDPQVIKYTADDWKDAKTAKDPYVARNINEEVPLKDQIETIFEHSLGDPNFYKKPKLGRYELYFSFKSKPLARAELTNMLPIWSSRLEEEGVKHEKKSSGSYDDESSASSSSGSEEKEAERKRLEQLKLAEEEEKRKEAERIRLEQLKLAEDEEKRIKAEREIEQLIKDMRKQVKKIYRSYEVNEPHLPEFRLFWKAQEDVLKDRKYKALKEEDKFQALQYAAVEVLQKAFNEQTEKYEHDLDLCIKLTIGLGILLISLPIIWIAFWALHHSDDIKKVAVDRQTFNGFQKAWYGADAKSAEALIEHPEHKPAERDHGNAVYGQGEKFGLKTGGQVHAYFWNSKDYQRFIADLDEYKATLQVEAK